MNFCIFRTRSVRADFLEEGSAFSKGLTTPTRRNLGILRYFLAYRSAANFCIPPKMLSAPVPSMIEVTFPLPANVINNWGSTVASPSGSGRDWVAISIIPAISSSETLSNSIGSPISRAFSEAASVSSYRVVGL